MVTDRSVSPTVSEDPPARRISGRIQFIDLLRGWAVIVMVETHVLNASLSPEIMKGEAFQLIKFMNGLVAPAFLFASGLAFAVTTHRKIADYLSFGPKFLRQLARVLSIIAVGYLLHLPRFSLGYLLTLTAPSQWESVYLVDILQCIGVSLLVMQLVLVVVRSERAMYALMTLITAAVLAVTPEFWGIDFWAFTPPILAEYMNGLHNSLFPLFPWSTFLFAGALTGYWYVQSGMEGSRMRVLTVLVGAGAVLIAISFIAEPLASKSYTVYNYWQYSPTFVLLRLGLICFLTAGMFLYEGTVGVSPSSPVALMGRESLLVYVAHLLLIFGDFGPINFRQWSARSFGYAEALVTVGILLLAMYLLSVAWSKMRTRGKSEKRKVQLVVLAIMVATFLLAPAG